MNTVHQQMKREVYREPWRMLACLLLAQLLVAFIGRSVGPLGVLIGEDLELTKSQIGMLPAALFLGQGLASIPVGFVVDQTGSKKLLLVISLCVGGSFILMTFSHQFGFVLLLVAIGGLGYGAMHPVTNRGIIHWFQKTQRGFAMGIKQTGITTGSALAGLVLLPLASVYGWRHVVAIACLVLIIGGVVTFTLYHDSVRETNSQGKSRFVYSMKHMLTNKPLMIVSISAMGLSGSQLCLVTYIVIYCYEYLHISLFLSGVLLVISEICGSIGRIVWGLISDRLFKGKRVIVLMIISGIAGVASLTLAFLPSFTTFLMMIPITMVFGFAISGFNALWMNVASEVVDVRFSGLSSGFSITLGSLGVITLPPLFGFIVDSFGSFTAGWLMIVGVMIVVFLLLLLLILELKKKAAY
ncbi:MFS transporter [Rossellomorea aquimaris]|jgi:MFS transporter, ACS family, hexuronate transporter|uniref:MFS transporter n=1 Tax=Rossellomorea aquimaris TaxID=189382 RepID=A0A1J6WY21_9BACI|nr:MFS transporter [Rossellomorea aquimaris]OIU72727.1 MFS transporter [Rossellomorea aquimaris]